MALRRLKRRLSGLSVNTLLIAAFTCRCAQANDSKARAALPARIVEAAVERTEARWYPSLMIAIVDGDKSSIISFGKLDSGRAPDRRTVYEIGSITKTFTAALLAQAILSGRVTPD